MIVITNSYVPFMLVKLRYFQVVFLSNFFYCSQISDSSNPWTVFIETVPPDSGLKSLTAFDKDSDVLLFFKYYDPRDKRLHYCGHHYMHISFNVRKYFNS